MADQIVQLDELIQANLPENTELKEKTVTNLIAPGENYWSDMLKLDIVVKNKETGRQDILNEVAKIVVQDNDQVQMNIPMFKSEIKFYTEIIPAIQNFMKTRGLPEATFFPELFAARLNLEGHSEADKNAVLILENLTSKGYINIDRHTGFDFEAAKVVVSDLAVFHAVPLAMRLEAPEDFKQKIVDNCFIFKLPTPQETEAKGKKMPIPPFRVFRQILELDAFCRQNLSIFDKFVEVANERMKNGMMGVVNPGNEDEPFLTLTHKDMWINNTMQLIKNNKVVKNKIIDFQMFAIDNPINDLLFLLITSVEVTVLENHFDYFLNLYHEKFITILESCRCNVEPYSHKHFLTILKDAAIEKFIHLTLMTLIIIFATKGRKVDFHNMDSIKMSDIHMVARKKLIFIFTEMVKRGWYE